MKRIMVFGTFDMMHPGHLHYFVEAKKLGDELIVVVARDSNVQREKGSLPVVSENDRLTMVSHIDVVDKATLGGEEDKLAVVVEYKPDIICLGYDQRVDEENLALSLKERGVDASIVRVSSYNGNKYKSGILKDKGMKD